MITTYKTLNKPTTKKQCHVIHIEKFRQSLYDVVESIFYDISRYCKGLDIHTRKAGLGVYITFEKC